MKPSDDNVLQELGAQIIAALEEVRRGIARLIGEAAHLSNLHFDAVQTGNPSIEEMQESVEQFIALAKSIDEFLEMHIKHTKALWHDATSGARSRSGGYQGAMHTKHTVQQARRSIWDAWEAKAREIWRQNPKAGGRYVAKRVAKRHGGNVSTNQWC